MDKNILAELRILLSFYFIFLRLKIRKIRITDLLLEYHQIDQ